MNLPTVIVDEGLVTIWGNGDTEVLLAAPNVDLAKFVTHLADLRDALDAADEKVRGELARRLDADNTRKAPLVTEDGEVVGELEVNAPQAEEYDPAELRRELELLADGVVLTDEAIASVVRVPIPKPPAPKVYRRELDKLKNHPDRRVAQAIARVRRVVPTSRKVKVTLGDA